MNESDDLLAALRTARPAPDYQPSPASEEAVGLLTRILAQPHASERSRPTLPTRRLVLAGIPVAAVAAAAAGFAVATREPARRASSAGSGQLPSAATLRTAILDAFGQASGDILATVLTGPDLAGKIIVHQRIWNYPLSPQPGQQVRYRWTGFQSNGLYSEFSATYTEPKKGKPITDAVTVFVDYHERTWFGGEPSSVPVPSSIPATPRQVLSQIGYFQVAGTGKVDGREALKLEFYRRDNGTATSLTQVLWVDAATYEPLEGSTLDTRRIGDKVQTYGFRYQVLPATAANLGLFAMSVPAGFTRLTACPIQSACTTF
jgi:hypothetical protein